MLQIRENKKSVGFVKKIDKRLKLKYYNKIIKIKERPSSLGIMIKINDENYQFLDNEIRKWPSKEKLILIKRKYGRIYFETPKRERVMKVKMLENIIKFKFFKEPSDIIIYLIAGLHYLTRQ